MKKSRIVLVIIAVLGLLVGAWLLLAHAEALIVAAGSWAYVLYVLLIIVEVVLAPIPGGVLALLGAAYFGFFPAWPLNYLGNVVGALIAFSLARRFGRPLVDRLVDKKTQRRYERFVHSHPVVLFLVYAVPVLPIDILSLLLGLSSLSLHRFALISGLGLISYSGILAYLGSRFGVYVPYLEEMSLVVVVVIVGGAALWFFKQQRTLNS